MRNAECRVPNTRPEQGGVGVANSQSQIANSQCRGLHLANSIVGQDRDVSKQEASVTHNLHFLCKKGGLTSGFCIRRFAFGRLGFSPLCSSREAVLSHGLAPVRVRRLCSADGDHRAVIFLYRQLVEQHELGGASRALRRDPESQ